ncbi:MAG: hypothetical protein A2849_00975 [Candidatus Taylorbacteria bacterium RIFCSPHIGHO2_01_FULL_51_15]|uniref:Addiction module toxin RelE n=1 Tax=Candidatus Taylorbacteria bacterium RIFCSPHIGHO2_01_FULL_51_15 TaxID=1802304 RepID=A0A1G2MBB6_9BACT|nr:MAG: hypothetical protein A2849_00975 [Candidatus Taylorbacteria bacterium RIFCSPHIGHO2_01_FULL_51_15]
MLYYSARFRKQWKRLPLKVRDEAALRLETLQVHEFDSLLNNHKLSGKYAEYRSINVTGDIRIAYKRGPDGFYLFAIGTHSELYK